MCHNGKKAYVIVKDINYNNCLIFVKGSPKAATERLGDVEVPDLDKYMEDEDEDN